MIIEELDTKPLHLQGIEEFDFSRFYSYDGSNRVNDSDYIHEAKVRAIKPKVKLSSAQQIFAPFYDIATMLSNFAPYRSGWEPLEDEILLPLFALVNLVYGIFLLASAPFNPAYWLMPEDPFETRMFAQLAYGIGTLCKAISQLLFTPIAWGLKLPLRAAFITPIARMFHQREWKKTFEQAFPQQIATIKPEPTSFFIKPHNPLKNQAMVPIEVPLDVISKVAEFLNTRELVFASRTSRQFYKAFNQRLLSGNMAENIYYTLGAGVATYQSTESQWMLCLSVLNDIFLGNSSLNLYKSKRMVPREELIESYQEVSARHPRLLLFKDKQEARQCAIAARRVYDDETSYCYFSIPPVFTVLHKGNKTALTECLVNKFAGNNDKKTIVIKGGFFQAPPDALKLIEADVVDEKDVEVTPAEPNPTNTVRFWSS